MRKCGTSPNLLVPATKPSSMDVPTNLSAVNAPRRPATPVRPLPPQTTRVRPVYPRLRAAGAHVCTCTRARDMRACTYHTRPMFRNL